MSEISTYKSAIREIIDLKDFLVIIDSFEFDQESEIEAVSSYFHNIQDKFTKSDDSKASINGYYLEQIYPARNLLLEIQAEIIPAEFKTRTTSFANFTNSRKIETNDQTNIYVIRKENFEIKMSYFRNEDFGRSLEISGGEKIYQIDLAFSHETVRNRRLFLGHRGIGLESRSLIKFNQNKLDFLTNLDISDVDTVLAWVPRREINILVKFFLSAI